MFISLQVEFLVLTALKPRNLEAQASDKCMVTYVRIYER